MSTSRRSSSVLAQDSRPANTGSGQHDEGGHQGRTPADLRLCASSARFASIPTSSRFPLSSVRPFYVTHLWSSSALSLYSCSSARSPFKVLNCPCLPCRTFIIDGSCASQQTTLSRRSSLAAPACDRAEATTELARETLTTYKRPLQRS